jgi:hypothetical protein
MNLLFKRGQADAMTGKVTFKLWAKTELDDDEMHIVQRYRFDNAVLINIDQPDLFRAAVRRRHCNAFASLLISVLWTTGMPLPLLIRRRSPARLPAIIYYDKQTRKRPWSPTSSAGATFTCDSVVDIARKEAWVS